MKIKYKNRKEIYLRLSLAFKHLLMISIVMRYNVIIK